MSDLVIHEQEQKDGLTEKLSASRSLAWHSPVSVAPDASIVPSLVKLIGKTRPEGVTRATNKGQPDLFYLETILVSTGWNLNKDVFHPVEVWDARHSPEDKQFNYEHNSADIIGHITSNRAVDDKGLTIPNDTSPSGLPSLYHILTGAVLYKYWEDPAKQTRMEEILAGIIKGEWYVSMECLFQAFDYALRDKAGQQKIVRRNASTAFLTKHLTAYGGDGTYKDYEIGRLLRDIVFSGKGLVKEPANPDSVILSSSTARKNVGGASDLLVYDEFMRDEQMSDKTNIDELTADLAKVKAELVTSRERVASLEKELTQATANLQTSQATVTKLTEAHGDFEKTIAELQGQVQTLESDKRSMARMQLVMTKLSVDEKAAGALVKPSLASDDTVFGTYVEALAAITKKPTPAPAPPLVNALDNPTPVPEPALATVSDDDADDLFREVDEYFPSED